MLQRDELLSDGGTVEQVVTALQNCNMHVLVGEVYQATREPAKALEAYRKGHAFAKAIDLARISFPAGKFVLIHSTQYNEYNISVSYVNQR